MVVVAALWAAPVQAEVRISGVDGQYKKNIELFLSLARVAADADAVIVARAFQRAPREIRTALQPWGYYSPRISSRLEPATEDEAWVAHFTIDVGTPVRLRHVQVRVEGEGRDLPDVAPLLENVPLRSGEQLDHAVYTRFKNRLLETVYAAGYLDAAYAEARLEVVPAVAAADVALVLASGPRYYFGEIDLRQDVLAPEFVQRYVHIRPGDPFQPDRLVGLQLDLSDSDYFSSVEIGIGRDRTVDQRVPVTVQAQPNRPRRYTASVGFGTDTGPRVNVGALFRRLNRWGHQAQFDARVSGISNELGAEYGIPIGEVAYDRLTFFGSAEETEVGDADTDQFRVGVRRQETWGPFRRDLYLAYSHENFAFGDQPGNTATLLTPGIGLSMQRSDDAIYTRRGYSFSTDVHGAPGLVSDTGFLQGTVHANAVLPLGATARLLLRGSVGATVAGEFERLPPSQRFFTGGDRSVRGYAFESIAPDNAFGDEIGGRYLAVFSVEADMPVRGNFGVAAFYDTGSASDAFGEQLRDGVGVGLRYRSPVGMVRLDVAHPLDDDDTNFRIHVTFGPDL